MKTMARRRSGLVGIVVVGLAGVIAALVFLLSDSPATPFDRSAPPSAQRDPVGHADLRSEPLPTARRLNADAGTQAVIHVHVDDEHGAPLPDIPVAALVFSGRAWGVSRQSRTDARGDVSLAMKPGSYRIVVNLPKLGTADLERQEKRVELKSGETRRLAFRLRARTAMLVVNVRDEDGRPVDGITVSLDQFRTVALTDRAGNVRFQHLFPGRIRVQIRSEEPTACAVAIPSGASRDVTLQARSTSLASFVLSRTGSLETRIQLIGGTPPPTARISVELVYLDTGKYTYPSVSHRVASPGVAIRFENLPPGSYLVRYPISASLPFYVTGGTEAVVVESKQCTKHVATATWSAHDIEGRVIDFEGDPVPRAPILTRRQTGDLRLSAWTAYKSAITNEKGYFIVKGLPKGSYRIEPFPEQQLRGTKNYSYFGSFEKPFVEAWVPAEPVRIVFARGCVIRGHVTKHGVPVRRGDVFIDRAKRPSPTSARLHKAPDGHEGFFEFRHLRRGSYRLWFEQDGKRLGVPRTVVVKDESAEAATSELEWELENHR